MAGEELTPDEPVQFRVLVMQMAYDWIGFTTSRKRERSSPGYTRATIATRRDIVAALSKLK
jgi:hypothetical protein